MLGYALGDEYLLQALGYLGALVLGRELLRVLCCAGCGALFAALLSMQRLLELSVRAIIPILAPAVLQPSTP